MINVKFRNDVVPQDLPTLPPHLTGSITDIKPLFTLSPEDIEVHNPDLDLWYQLTVAPSADTDNVAADLQKLDQILSVEIISNPPPLP